MSSASVASSKRERVNTELSQEIESIRAMNSSLRVYLEHLRMFKKNIVDLNDNFTQCNKVHTQWNEFLNNIK